MLVADDLASISGLRVEGYAIWMLVEDLYKVFQANPEFEVDHRL